MRYYARIIVEWLIRHQAIENEDEELYEYAICSLGMLIAPLFMALMVGVCIGGVKESIVVVIPFMIIRKFSGGYHAKYLWMCITSSTLLISLCVWASFYLRYDWKMAVVTAITGIGLGYLSPIDHENKRLNDAEQKVYKKRTIILTSMIWGIALILYFWGQEIYAECLSIGIVLTAGLQWPVVLKRKIPLVYKGTYGRKD